MAEDEATQTDEELELENLDEQNEDENTEEEEGAEGQGGEEEGSGEGDKPPKKQRPTHAERQQEIDRKTWALQEERRQLEEVTARANTAIDRLEAAEAKAGNPKPQEDDFDTNAEFIEASVDWKVKQAIGEKKVETQTNTPPQKNTQTNHSWNAQYQKATTKYPDFAENEQYVGSVINHFKNQDMGKLIMESEKGAEIIQHFGGNSKELERIAQLSPASVIKEIWKLEEGFNKVPMKRQTGMKTPPSTPRGGGKAKINANNLSPAEFAEKRNKGEI